MIRSRLAPLAVALLAACGGSASSPEGAVGTWLDALEARDSAALADAFTPRTAELVAEIESLSAAAQGGTGRPAIGIEDWCTAFCGGAVEGSTLHGDSATVRVRVEESIQEIPVVRGEDGWRIDLAGRLEPAVQMLRLATRPDPAAAPSGPSAPDTTPPLP